MLNLHSDERNIYICELVVVFLYIYVCALEWHPCHENQQRRCNRRNSVKILVNVFAYGFRLTIFFWETWIIQMRFKCRKFYSFKQNRFAIFFFFVLLCDATVKFGGFQFFAFLLFAIICTMMRWRIVTLFFFKIIILWVHGATVKIKSEKYIPIKVISRLTFIFLIKGGRRKNKIVTNNSSCLFSGINLIRFCRNVSLRLLMIIKNGPKSILWEWSIYLNIVHVMNGGKTINN